MLTEAEKSELVRLADKSRITQGMAEDLRAASRLARKGLVSLVREWREWEGGIGYRGNYVTFRRYVITPAGRATLKGE